MAEKKAVPEEATQSAEDTKAGEKVANEEGKYDGGPIPKIVAPKETKD